MPNELHDLVFEFLESYRAKHRGFRYWLRERNTKSRPIGARCAVNWVRVDKPVQECCIKDGSRSTTVAVQAEAVNHHLVQVNSPFAVTPPPEPARWPGTLCTTEQQYNQPGAMSSAGSGLHPPIEMIRRWNEVIVLQGGFEDVAGEGHRTTGRKGFRRWMCTSDESRPPL